MSKSMKDRRKKSSLQKNTPVLDKDLKNQSLKRPYQTSLSEAIKMSKANSKKMKYGSMFVKNKNINLQKIIKKSKIDKISNDKIKKK